MPNILQQGIQNLVSWAFNGKTMDAFETEITARQKGMGELFAYYEGRQRRPLRIAPAGRDYNVMANLTGVIVNRSVSMLIGPGVDFNVPEAEGTTDTNTPHQYIEDVWEANRGDILLHDLVQFGSIYGTPYLKVIPNGKEWKGKFYPRLVALNPFNMIIQTASDDIEKVLVYVNRWNDGETAWREITENRDGTWYIHLEKADKETKGDWAQQGPEVTWEYPFPPIAHTKNLPAAGSVYGMSDIEAIIELQDRYNASQSDINTILANNAFPLRYVTGGKLPRITLPDGTQVVDITPAKILEFQSETAKMGIAEMQSDLSSSRSFAGDIRRDIFDLASTVDTETLMQNASNITNFGLRVTYKNELAKNAVKQMLYGDLLCTVNRNLLTMNGWVGDQTDPGEVTWGDPLPTNPIEETTALTADKALGIVSTKTISQIRDYDYEQEQTNLEEEAAKKNALGGSLLRDFLANKNQPRLLNENKTSKETPA